MIRAVPFSRDAVNRPSLCVAIATPPVPHQQIPHVTQPVIGRLYAALVEGEWHRVEVVSVKGIEVTCYFIDHGGDHDVLDVRVIREIEPKFLNLAAQAKRVRLAGLEEYATSQV